MPENTQNQPLTIKQLPAGSALNWVTRGFYLFKANPAMWIILQVIYLAIMIPVSLMPVIGSVVSTLLAPVFAAGMMGGCQALTRNQELEINHLFEGFKHNTSQLVSVGGIYMISLLFIAVIVVLTMDKDTVELLVKGKDLSPEQADGMLLPILIALLLIMPVMMAYLFAPILVGLYDFRAVQAMKLSFMACLKNILPLLLYALIIFMLIVPSLKLVTLLPEYFQLYFSVIVILVLAPIILASLYASYVDMFGIEHAG